MKKGIAIALLVNIGLFTACSSSDDSGDINGGGSTASLDVPETFVFNRNGSSSVDFSGQFTRIKMADELFIALKDNSNTEEGLLSMYKHQEGVTDFLEASLNESDKQIASKTASSVDFFSTNVSNIDVIQWEFEGFIEAQAANFPNWEVPASAGVAGFAQEAGGGSTRYVDANGVEQNQFFAKSLIGGLCVDQILNNYLSLDILDIGSNVVDNDNDVLVGGKNYTAMEHKWDEAYGYLFAAEPDDTTFTAIPEDELLNKYVKEVNGDSDFEGVTAELHEAYILGRAAIVAKDYELRNEQIAFIRQTISKAIAIRAVFYLQQGKSNLVADKASAFHDLSEGLGFINSLIYTRRSAAAAGAFFTKEEVDGYINDLISVDNGLWQEETVLSNKLDAISGLIADKFDFTIAEARN